MQRTFGPRWQEWAASPLWNRAMVLKRIEGQLAFDFASRAQLHSLRVSVDRPVALLSAMQHFGVPTRLLDWTNSAYVAVYFALEQHLHAPSAAVWALDLTALHDAATYSVLPIEHLPDGTIVRPPVRFIDFSLDSEFRRYVLPDLEEYHRSMLFGEPALEIVVPLIPRAQNKRLAAQQGLFLCPSQVGIGFMEQVTLLMNGVPDDWIVKIVIPRVLRDEVLKRLFQMNIHPLSLFPGADGLGRFCTQKAALWGLD